MTRPLAVVLLATLVLPAHAYPPESAYMRPFDWTMQSIYSSADWNITADRIVALGDSILHRMDVDAISAGTMQMGVSGTNLPAVCRHVTRYWGTSRRAAAVILEVGSNDSRAIIAGLWTLEDAYEAQNCLASKILVPLVWAAIHRVKAKGTIRDNPSTTITEQNMLIDKLNERAALLCKVRTKCAYVPSNLDAREGMLYDGLHPNPTGYQVWVPALRGGLNRVGVVP